MFELYGVIIPDEPRVCLPMRALRDQEIPLNIRNRVAGSSA